MAPEDLGTLFAENSLWQLYRQGEAFYKKRFNLVVVLVAAVFLSAFALVHFLKTGGTSNNRLDFPALFSSWANVGIGFAGTILGFVLAGFAVLFAVLRPATALRLAQLRIHHPKLNELKLILVTFVDVFVHYTMFIFWCAAYLIAGAKDGPADLIGRYLSDISPLVPSAVTHLLFVAWGIWFVLIILKLKSFIYNLYQVLLVAFIDA